MLGMPFYLFFEMLGPIVEMTGYVMFVLAWIFGIVNWKFALLFFILAGFRLEHAEWCAQARDSLRVRAVPTGIQVAVPKGYAGLIWDKSGISLKGVHRMAGVIDAGYRGEIQVVLVNLGPAPFPIKAGMKIAQLLIQPVSEVTVVESESLDDTPRGENGFGSTGLY